MGAESVSVAEALSHADTLEISCHSRTRVLLSALESMENKRHTSYMEAIQRTFTYKISEVQHINYWERLHELKLYSLHRRRERYIIIYIWKISQHMVTNIDGTMGHKIKTKKTSKTWNTVCYSVPDKQTPSAIPSSKRNNCIWASVVQLVAKISERHWNC